jgi:hypothetical protein
MKSILLVVFWGMIVLLSCQNESAKHRGLNQISDPPNVQEATQRAITRPDVGPSQPHPDLTPEEGDRLLRLKGNKSPWETDNNFLQAPDNPLEEQMPSSPASYNDLKPLEAK